MLVSNTLAKPLDVLLRPCCKPALTLKEPALFFVVGAGRVFSIFPVVVDNGWGVVRNGGLNAVLTPVCCVLELVEGAGMGL
jgi:hypothetical protein